MAQTSEDFLNRITGLTQQLGGTPLPTGQDIMSELSARVGDFAPQYQELRGAEAAATAAPTSVLGDLAQRFGGGGGAGPSAFRSLQSAMEERGRQFGTADVLRDILTQQQGTLGGIGQNILGQAESGRQNIMDQINTLMPLFQTLAGQEEAARGRSAGQLDIQKLIDSILGRDKDQTQDILEQTGVNEFGGTGQFTRPGTQTQREGLDVFSGPSINEQFGINMFNRPGAQAMFGERQVPGQILGGDGGGGGGGSNFLQGLSRLSPASNLYNIPSDIGQGFQSIRNLFR